MTNKAATTILVVDYDKVFQRSLTDLFNRAGYKAYGASNGKDAIGLAATLGTGMVDLMVVEMAQLDMTAVELIHTIAVQQRATIKVIASSSLFSQADMDIQTSFRSDAGIRKETDTADAAKWLLTARSLLGELADPAPLPSSCVILVADDDVSLRHFVKVILNRKGYQVLEAADGGSALALARKMAGAIDLVVTDIEMPGMDGTALGKAIREEYSHIPVIYISGFVENPDLWQLNRPEEGFASIAKPFLPNALLDTVSLMLHKAKRAG